MYYHLYDLILLDVSVIYKKYNDPWDPTNKQTCVGNSGQSRKVELRLDVEQLLSWAKMYVVYLISVQNYKSSNSRGVVDQFTRGWQVV